MRSYLLKLEELLLDLDPLRRRLVGLAPDELEHLVAAAADGPLRRMHHVGRGGHDVVVVARPLAHRAALVTHTMQWALRPTTDRSRKLEERRRGALSSLPRSLPARRLHSAASARQMTTTTLAPALARPQSDSSASLLCLNLQGWLQVRQPSCCLLLLGLPGSCRVARYCRSADFQFPLFSHARSHGEKRRSIDATWPNIFAKPFNQKGS